MNKLSFILLILTFNICTKIDANKICIENLSKKRIVINLDINENNNFVKTLKKNELFSKDIIIKNINFLEIYLGNNFDNQIKKGITSKEDLEQINELISTLPNRLYNETHRIIKDFDFYFVINDLDLERKHELYFHLRAESKKENYSYLSKRFNLKFETQKKN